MRSNDIVVDWISRCTAVFIGGTMAMLLVTFIGWMFVDYRLVEAKRETVRQLKALKK